MLKTGKNLSHDYYAGETIENHLLKLAGDLGRKEVPRHFSEAEE